MYWDLRTQGCISNIKLFACVWLGVEVGWDGLDPVLEVFGWGTRGLGSFPIGNILPGCGWGRPSWSASAAAERERAGGGGGRSERASEHAGWASGGGWVELEGEPDMDREAAGLAAGA